MQVFAQKSKATRQITPAKPAVSSRALVGQSRDFSQMPLHLRSPANVQAKLMISAPGDIYEEEADRVSERVMRMPEPQLQRACPCGGGCPTCQAKQSDHEHERLQMKRVQATDPGQIAAPPIVHEVLRSPGHPLDLATRAFMEPRFAYDFSRVRVHSSAVAEQSARDMNADAYATGQNIVFGAGRFAPATHEGRRLIAHELTHVVQQSGSNGLRVGQDNKKRGLSSISQQGDADHVQRFVPCEQPSLSLQSCPPRDTGEVAQSKEARMTLHKTPLLSDHGDSVNGYLVVGFEVGKSAIKRNLRDLLEWKQLVTRIKSTNVQWKIQGLSDCSGSRNLNEGIRRARAEAIYNLLPEDARKHVVSRESVPLSECITGNQRKVDREVNRSVLIEQVGRTVDIDPTEEKVLVSDPPKFVCGPDVTRQVAEAVRFAGRIFNGWSHSQKVDGCDALISLEGFLRSKKGGDRGDFVAGCSWDIYQLHRNDWINKDFQPICATTGAKPGCGESIQVDDDCHHAGAVNYVIFGTMFRLCSNSVSDDFYFDFSKSNMRALIDIRKGSGISGLATPVVNSKGSFAWAAAGFDGWPSGVSSPSGDWNHCAPMCPLPYSGPSFDIHWYPHRSKYTCP